MKSIASPKVSIGFAAAVIVVIVNAVVAYQSISTIAENNRSISEIHLIAKQIDSPQERLRQRSKLTELDRLQAESSQSLDGTKIAVGFSGLLDLCLLVFLYGLVNWDLTKKYQAELTLRNSIAEFEELYHNAPCGYHSLDATGKFVRINRTELQMLGYTESEVIGCKHILDLFAPSSVKIFTENFPVIKSQGWMHDLEFEMLRKDGQTVPVSATVVAIYDPDGNYIGSRSTIVDTSDRIKLRKQTQLSAEISQKIRQSLELDEILQTAVAEVQQLLEVDRVLIFRFDPDGFGHIVQEKVVAGYPVLMGNGINDPCFDQSYHDRYQQGRVYNIADITQAGFKPCYVEFLQKFGVQASSIVPIQLRDQLWGLLIVHHCRSTRQWQPKEVEIMSQLATQLGIALAQSQLLAQEQLQRAELTRSNAELEQFAHIASHDLQEPLRMVISYLQLLERRYHGKLDRDADEFINYAVDGAVRMQTLIQALLSYARVSSRKQPFEVVDCNLVCQDAISNLQIAIEESSAIVSVDPLPEVWGDATQLTQLFQNLIANALKFRRDIPPQIQISVRPITDDPVGTTTAWCFAIKDNGIGIEAQYLDRIFVIFQRLHTRVNYPGTGIGLAICKKIIERHNGTIWVDSVPIESNPVLAAALPSQSLPVQPENCGSIFYVTIPAVGNISSHYANNQSHY
jgi:PAS domain S-box-containing protein